MISALRCIDDSQYTIVFYVDDNMIAHKIEKVLTKVMNELLKHILENWRYQEEDNILLLRQIKYIYS